MSPSRVRSEARGFYYAPDPSSQIACTIGGNVAENSGGLHCLKYGLTTNNLLGVEIALPGGRDASRWAARRRGSRGWIFSGSSLVRKACWAWWWRRRCASLPKPPVTRTMLAAFRRRTDAGALRRRHHRGRYRSGGDGIHGPRCIAAVEAYYAPGYPRTPKAILIIDADGIEAEVD